MGVEALKLLGQAIHLDPDIRREIKDGLDTPTYSPYLAEMLRYTIEGVQNGILKSELVEPALGNAARLFVLADWDYRKGQKPLSGEALARHQANVLAGKIELVSPEAATTDEQGIRQVETADSFLSNQGIQATLTAINYGAFFRPQTMASATRTLDRRAIDKLLAIVDSTQEAMPHLSVSNWAIGQTVAGIYRYVAELPFGRLRIFDIGSGHGATIAATTSSIHNSDGINRRPELSITGLETTPEFYQELTGFVRRDEGIAALNLKPVEDVGESELEISRFSALTTVRGDALNSLQRSNLSSGVEDSDITVITANYSWHRFSGHAKAAIMRMFHPLPNTIFIIGDLAQNTSVINRRYFNLGVNGPLNCGNRHLSHQFGNFGYEVVDLDRERPSALDPRLTKRISYDNTHNDGHLWIAYWGRLASEALHLVPAV